MKIFISWSGSLSQQLADKLWSWLPRVIQSVQTYVSHEDIVKGSRWSVDVSSELGGSNFGILCITPANIGAPWLNFEAGALSNSFGQGLVSPFLFGVKPERLQAGPLGQFQATSYDRRDVFRLVRNLNSSSNTPLESSLLETTFDTWWPGLKASIDELEKLSLEESDAADEHGIADKIDEILDLTRAGHKALSTALETLPSRSIAQRPVAAERVKFDEVNYLIGRLHTAISSAVIPDNPGTAQVAHARALLVMLTNALGSMINPDTVESIARINRETLSRIWP